MHRIDVTNQQSLMRINARRLRQAVRHVLRSEEIQTADVSLAIVDDAAIRTLNRRHLRHDYATDVLSFLLDSETHSGRRAPWHIDGEVIVSAETALRRSAEFGWSPVWELMLYVVHGTLHLCGYEDETPARQRRMRQRERAVFRDWGVTIRYQSGRANIDAAHN